MALFSRTKIQGVLDSWTDRLPRPLAIALDLVPADPEYAGLIRGAQLSAIVRLTPIAMFASCLNAVILLVIFAYTGRLGPELWIWAAMVFALAASFLLNWRRNRRFDAQRPASRRAIRKAVLNGGIFGALWGVVPAVTFPGAPLEIQLFLGVLTSGMMCAGGFGLATVPLAGALYVLLVATGSFYALQQQPSAVYLGVTAMMVVYTAVIIVNLSWSASLFVSSRLAEARVRTEVAAREKAQVQAAHAERMSALGQLAGGIAHDFNNILQAVSGGASLIDCHADDRDYVQRQARRIQDAVERGSATSRRLLAFARRDVLVAELIDAADLLKEMDELLAYTIGPSIAIRTEVASGPLAFLADRRQLETVLLNLATNARDAMPNGGVVTVSASSEVLDQDTRAPPLKAGRYVRISVADTGVGMDAATLARAEEPFFSTKPKGKGTGLGLSMAKGFAEQSGGAFLIASEPGRGARVTLWLPQAEIAVAPSASESIAAAAKPRRARRCVLVVDDDDLVRDVLMTSLQDAGFVPLGADGADQALAHLDRGAEVDALVTDLSMPGPSGWDLIRELQSRQLELPTVLLTGHVGEEASDAAEHPHPRRFLLMQKPVPPAQLAERLTELMANDRP
jgi:signal transduction histidine kinase